MANNGRMFLFFLFTTLSLKACFCDDTIEVKLKQGVLSGKVEKTFLKNINYYSFKGIPYAEAPVNELRFKPPKPHKGWEGKYNAFSNKPSCMQLNSGMRNRLSYGVSGSEDCLFISVFTPNLEGSAAVAVFDFNENFKTGYNGTRKYSPDFFAEEDVVVVTISHRLSIFGYLTTEDDVIPANNGLRDYLLGLKWVRDNIKHFGGNPDRVTLMGSKGGSSLANIMLYSKKATGLFNGVTMQSGTIHEATYFPDNPKQYSYKFAKLFDIETEDSETLLKELQKIEAGVLYEKADEISNSFDFFNKYQMNIYPFSPVIEKDNSNAILTTKPENGKIVNDVPVLIGLNSREGLDHASYVLLEPRIINEMTDFFVHFPIRYGFRFDGNSTALQEYKEEINKFYFKVGYLTYDNLLDYAIYLGDTVINYAINHAARNLAKELQSPTYYYMFDFLGTLNENMLFVARNSRGSIGNWGATYADELCYLHVCNQIKKNYHTVTNTVSVQNEVKVLKKMVRMWTNFVKTGNPTPNKQDDVLKNFIWQPIDKESENLKYLHITKALRMEINPLGKREVFWNKTLKKYSEMAVDGVVLDLDTTERDEL